MEDDPRYSQADLEAISMGLVGAVVGILKQIEHYGGSGAGFGASFSGDYSGYY